MNRFSMITTGKGIVLCDKEDGAFLVLKSAWDLVHLKNLLDKITYLKPDISELFEEEASID